MKLSKDHLFENNYLYKILTHFTGSSQIFYITNCVKICPENIGSAAFLQIQGTTAKGVDLKNKKTIDMPVISNKF